MASSVLSNLQNYNIDWTMDTWRCDSDIPWMQTVQKIATLGLIPLLMLLTFELLVKNLVVVSCVKLGTKVIHACPGN